MLHMDNHFSLVLALCILIISNSCICTHGNGLSSSVTMKSPPRPPATVNVGALLAYNTTMGRVAKQAIEMALEDVNNSPSLLNGTQLVLTMMDSNCSAFLGTAAGTVLSPSIGLMLFTWAFELPNLKQQVDALENLEMFMKLRILWSSFSC